MPCSPTVDECINSEPHEAASRACDCCSCECLIGLCASLNSPAHGFNCCFLGGARLAVCQAQTGVASQKACCLECLQVKCMAVASGRHE
jgi:hypothetical protein